MVSDLIKHPRGSERIDPARSLAKKLLLRCDPKHLPLKPEDVHKAAETAAILEQIVKSSWVHGWVDTEGKPGKYRTNKGEPPQQIWIGGMGNDEMITKYVQIPLPATPIDFLNSLQVHLNSPISQLIQNDSQVQFRPKLNKHSTSSERATADVELADSNDFGPFGSLKEMLGSVNTKSRRFSRDSAPGSSDSMINNLNLEGVERERDRLVNGPRTPQEEAQLLAAERAAERAAYQMIDTYAHEHPKVDQKRNYFLQMGTSVENRNPMGDANRESRIRFSLRRDILESARHGHRSSEQNMSMALAFLGDEGLKYAQERIQGLAIDVHLSAHEWGERYGHLVDEMRSK